MVRTEYKYERLVLTCDLASIARIHTLLRAELTVVTPVPDGAVVRSITVRENVPPPAPRWVWLSIVGLTVGLAVSTVVYVAGWVAVVGWITR
jgi:hypothetical protein